MTCKDAINSDTNSDDKKVYLLEKSRSYNKIFESDLQGTNDQIGLMWFIFHRTFIVVFWARF